jgi:outer membrane protein OmpA-like peptidoglycan-associated protein
MRRTGLHLIRAAFLLALLAGPVAADPGWISGVDVGVSEPTNGNYRAHVHAGATINPYVGYMFHPNVGVQSQLHFIFQPSDDDDRGFASEGIDIDENETTSLFGFGIGPRVALPVWNVPSPSFIRGIEIYTVAQGAMFQGMSGRMEKTSAGLSVGGGIDFYLTDHWAFSVFGRWNRAWQSPRPITLPDTKVVQSPGEQGPHDAEWATVGIGVKYDFREPPAPLVCPECVCPQCPVTKKILLRSVTFDFDKTELRPDSEPVIDEAIRIIKEQDGDFTVILEGHTDNIGSLGYNQELSELRAENVRRYMIDHGLPAERIRSVGYGKTRPIADNATPEGRARNRRVDPTLEQ